MDRLRFQDIPLQPRPFAGIAAKAPVALLALFIVQSGLVWSRPWLPASWLGHSHWPEGVLVVLATATTLVSMGRQLPAQNIMLAASVIAVIGGAAHSLGALTGIPFGPYMYNAEAGRQLFYPLPWPVPFLWMVALLNSRGVARLILRPWRKTRTYGFRLIGLTVLLVVVFDLAFEPFASRIENYWRWQPTKIPFSWYGAPVSNFPAWGLISLLILAFVTPVLLNKKPVKFPPDYHPLMVWLMLNGLFLTAALAHQLWLAAGVILALNAVITAYALRGAKWA